MVLFITGVRNINLQVYKYFSSYNTDPKAGTMQICSCLCAGLCVMPAFITFINYVITFLIFSSSTQT